MARSRKNIDHKNLARGIIILLVIGIIFYLANLDLFARSQANLVKQNSTASNMYNMPNLNLTDVVAITHNPDYVSTYTVRTTLFSPSLMQLGYLASSSSMFNFTGSINNSVTVPATIGSAVFLMKNSSLATNYVNSMLSSNNANQSIRGYVLNSTSVSNYGSAGKNVLIYTISAVAVFNTSVIGSPDRILPMPDYQYTSIFSYNNAVGTVVINSYTDRLNGTLSRYLAEALAIKLAAYNCCAQN